MGGVGESEGWAVGGVGGVGESEGWAVGGVGESEGRMVGAEGKW